MIRIPYLREAGALLLLAGLSFAAWKAYGWAYDNGYNAANVRAEKVIGEMAKAEAAAQAMARVAERKRAQAIADALEQYERGKADAQADADRIAAGLRAGNVRLRDHWAGCETDRLSQGAATAAELARQDELRRESLRRVLGWVGRLQAQRDALIEAYPSDAPNLN